MRATRSVFAPLLAHSEKKVLIRAAQGVVASSEAWQGAAKREGIEQVGRFERVRTGVVRQAALEGEWERLEALVENGDRVRSELGNDRLIGVDEAGRGCWAGHVCAAAVYVPQHVLVEGAKDSKKLSEKHRVWVYQQMLKHPEVLIAVDMQSPAEIDEKNILNATRHAMRRCVQLIHDALPETAMLPPSVVIDGCSMVKAPQPFTTSPPQLSGSFGEPVALKAVECEKGDHHHLPVALASIVAKTLRDATMYDLHANFPDFGFLKHKAYGTARHQEALRNHGPIAGVHRRSFKPMKNMENWQAA